MLQVDKQVRRTNDNYVSLLQVRRVCDSKAGGIYMKAEMNCNGSRVALEEINAGSIPDTPILRME
jgi:hypothetical protein